MTAGKAPAPFAIDAGRVDPSMEEILASIRKIIADDDSSQPALRKPAPLTSGPMGRPSEVLAVEEPRPSPTVTSLTPPFIARPAPVAVPPELEPAMAAAEPTSEPVPEPTAAIVDLGKASAERRAADSPMREVSMPEDDDASMVSTMTKTSVASAFQALSASVAISSREIVETHVRDMLRPMLKQWLDDNLPTIVERLVRVEIERVARGGR